MILITPAAIRRIAIIISITGLMIAFAGAFIFAWVYNTSPYAATVGFAIYAIVAGLLGVSKIVRLTTFETTLEELHTQVAALVSKMDELFEYVQRNL